MDEANGREYLVMEKEQEKACSSMKHVERIERLAALRIKLFWVLWKHAQWMSRRTCTSFLPKVKHLTVNKKERKKVRLNAGEKETLTKYFCYDFQNYAMSNKDSLNVQLDSKR